MDELICVLYNCINHYYNRFFLLSDNIKFIVISLRVPTGNDNGYNSLG